jgi:hypothetical protein
MSNHRDGSKQTDSTTFAVFRSEGITAIQTPVRTPTPSGSIRTVRTEYLE